MEIDTRSTTPTSHHHHQQQSLLLALPPELRNKIYTLVLPTTHTIDCWTLKSTDRSPHALSLTQVCRHLHTETKHLPYTLPTFIFPTHATFTRFITTLASRPEGKSKLRKIRNIEFRVEAENVTVCVPVVGGGRRRAMPLYWWNEMDLGFWQMGLVGLRSVGVVFVGFEGRGWEEDGVEEGEFWELWEGVEGLVRGVWERGKREGEGEGEGRGLEFRLAVE